MSDKNFLPVDNILTINKNVHLGSKTEIPRVE